MRDMAMELLETAKKAYDASAAADGGSAEEIPCIDALRVLKSFPVNAKILIDTQVGKGLQHLKKHLRKKIQAYAVDLIGIWKNIISEEANRNKNRKSDKKPYSKGDGKIRPTVVVESDPFVVSSTMSSWNQMTPLSNCPIMALSMQLGSQSPALVHEASSHFQ